MSPTPAHPDPWHRALGALAVLGLALGWPPAFADARAGPCAVWTLPMLEQSRDHQQALRFQLQYRDDSVARSPWSWYALVVAESAGGPAVPFAIDALTAPRALEALQLSGYARPVFAVWDWYRSDPDRRWVLYLLRLPAPEPRLAALGLEVKPDLPGRLPPETADKSHGPVPTKVLVLEPAEARGLSRRALVCRAHSHTP